MSFIDSIKDIDTKLFLFLNGKHNSFFDGIMFWSSHRFTWIPLYILFFFLVYRHFGKRTWTVVLCVALLAGLSDQLSVHMFKNYFMRYRPCHNLLLQSQVHLNDGCGGTYGFISSHAANTFALATFLTLLFRKKMRYFGPLVISWACFVSYSRIYNGVHYPLDVIAGAMVGIILAVLAYILWKRMDRKFNPALTYE
jgi:undecaprenyl-diphosphatase